MRMPDYIRRRQNGGKKPNIEEEVPSGTTSVVIQLLLETLSG